MVLKQPLKERESYYTRNKRHVTRFHCRRNGLSSMFPRPLILSRRRRVPFTTSVTSARRDERRTRSPARAAWRCLAARLHYRGFVVNHLPFADKGTRPKEESVSRVILTIGNREPRVHAEPVHRGWGL